MSPACPPPARTDHSRVRWILASALVWASSCGPAAAPGPVRDYTGPLRAPATYASDFSVDHQITAIHAEGSESFRALLEKHGGTLTIVGLAPHGSRAFTLTQEGDDVRFESQMPREMPFPPRYILIDVHRTWLIGLAQPLPDGTHESTVVAGDETETVTDTWADGRLMTRTFSRAGAPEGEGPIRITYEGGLSPDPSAPAPSRIELDNQRFGYRLVMESITRSPI